MSIQSPSDVIADIRHALTPEGGGEVVLDAVLAADIAERLDAILPAVRFLERFHEGRAGRRAPASLSALDAAIEETRAVTAATKRAADLLEGAALPSDDPRARALVMFCAVPETNVVAFPGAPIARPTDGDVA